MKHTKEYYECDMCEKVVSVEESYNWIIVSSAGVLLTNGVELRTPVGHYCILACYVDALQESLC